MTTMWQRLPREGIEPGGRNFRKGWGHKILTFVMGIPGVMLGVWLGSAGLFEVFRFVIAR